MSTLFTIYHHHHLNSNIITVTVICLKQVTRFSNLTKTLQSFEPKDHIGSDSHEQPPHIPISEHRTLSSEHTVRVPATVVARVTSANNTYKSATAS
jgi:hypothetical protein